MSIYLFQRALRLDDNLGLIKCLQESDKVYPVFCVDPRQADLKKNKYGSPFAVGFMWNSLQDLNKQLKKHGSALYILHGEPHIVLKSFVKKHNITKIYMNRDYTPFAIKRTSALRKVCDVVEVNDYLLFAHEDVANQSGAAYRVFTPFWNAVLNKKVPAPRRATPKLLRKLVRGTPQKSALNTLKNNSRHSPVQTGGREDGLRRLKRVKHTQKNYGKCRDYLKYDTTHLSAYIKFGCISIREAWAGFNAELRRQLIWREFYYHMYIDFPELLEWDNHPPESKLSKNAPSIVKKCYKQLNETGFLHNRGRMILANYLLESTYWKSGDRMYARRLVDYDPLVNIGNWLWINKQPKFRRLKPERQIKYDAPCEKK